MVSFEPLDWEALSVLVTGHTGFKGSWLVLWLALLGAKVHGYSLDLPTHPSLFEVAGVDEVLASDTRADIRDLKALIVAMDSVRPDVVLHLAAQPLVRESYRDPVGTFDTNVLGTVNVLEAVRRIGGVKAVMVVTTDKVYENREWLYPYRESDALGGHDPYSASKAAAELATASFRSSFFVGREGRRTTVVTVRAGNAIGGGDWANERLIPDCLRAFSSGKPIVLRYPNAIRPWQHVLEPLGAYMRLVGAMLGPYGEQFEGAWNFGPDPSDDASVGHVAELVARLWGSEARIETSSELPELQETSILRLDTTRARTCLGWRPRWDLQTAVEKTVSWHKSWLAEQDMRRVTVDQIDDYCRELRVSYKT
jgi:CDP-glucose 4,6-dehydratase